MKKKKSKKAQDGSSVLSGYTNKGFDMPRAASESTAIMFFDPVTKRMVSTATTGQKKEDVKASTEAMGKAKRREEQEKKQRIAERKAAKAFNEGKSKTFTFPTGETKSLDQMDWREKAYVSGKSVEGKGRFNENDEAWYDDWLNPFGIIGNMSGALGTAPYEAKQSDSYMPYVGAVAAPLVAGALGFDPLGGAMKVPGKVAQSMESGLLSNTYKINPWANKVDPNLLIEDPAALYRGIGKSGKENLLQSKILTSADIKSFPEPYFVKGSPPGAYGQGYIAEVKNEPNTFKGFGLNNEEIFTTKPVNLENPNLKIYQSTPKGYRELSKTTGLPIQQKPNWLRGYKEVPKPQQTFKSEIDWSKWNPEIPDNTKLMQEYNAIEQTSKANGTWMKNPDGSPFQGTPEQFVQQNSQNFKKAFGNSKLVNPDGSPTIQYHGSAKKFDTFDESKFQLGDAGYSGVGIYTTPSKSTAESYAMSSSKFHSGKIEPTVYELYGQANNPISASQLIKENKGRDLFNFHRKNNWKGELTPEESLMQFDAAIADQLPNVERIRPWNDAREIVFPSNKQLKSAIGNNGMFDMTNPNIYKTLVPGAIGLGALQQKRNGGVIKDNNGYWNPDNWGKVVEIDSNDITMKGVYQPLLGISDEGDVQYMEPNKDYKFKGKKVREFPIARNGINNLDENSLQQLDQLTNFTNYNIPMAKSGKKIKKAQLGVGDIRTDNTMSHTTERLISDTPVHNMKNIGFNSDKLQGIMQKAAPYLSAASDVIGGFNQLGQEKNAVKQAQQTFELSDLARKASSTRPEEVERRYVRPEDMIVNPNQMYVSYGTGTNILAKNGAEIQNTYFSPTTIYTDSEYEPLNDSSKIKDFQFGGELSDTLSQFNSQGGGAMVNNLIGNAFGNNAGNSIGKGAGTAIGTVLGGPLGGMIGGFAGNLLGGALDGNQKKIKKYEKATQANNNAMMLQNNIGDATYQNSSFMEMGGQLTNPQLITRFGDIEMSSLKHVNDDMNTLRTGGSIRHNYLSELDSYALGGDIKTHWGGYAEHLSYNPFLPEEGQTVMFRGQSHDESDGKGNTGIGVSYGKAEDGANVEVQRNEPATKLYDASTGQTSLNVFGALNISKAAAEMIGDKDAKGLKVQNYIKRISEKENIANKNINKNMEQLKTLNPSTAFDIAKLNSLKMNIEGETSRLKNYAETKQKVADYQNTMNDYAQLHNLDAEALSKGKIKKAEHGVKLPIAQKGYSHISQGSGKIDYTPIGHTGNPLWDNINTYRNEWIPKVGNALSDDYVAKTLLSNVENYNGQDANDVKKAISQGRTYNEKLQIINKLATDEKPGPFHNFINNIINTTPKTLSDVTVSARKQSEPSVLPRTSPNVTLPDIKGKEPQHLNILPYVNEIASRLRKPLQAGYDSYIPEWYALSTNKLEPVQAQEYRPLLDTPYDISLQDQLNSNQSTFNSLSRLVNNPEALASLAGQKYEADSKVLAEQMRINQANKMGVFDKNRATLNDAQLKNLQLLDNQYVRQEQAKSNTKATTLEALKSIDDKQKQRDLENLTFATYSNLFPQYGFDSSGRAYNQGVTTFNIPDVSVLPSTATPPYVRQGREKKNGKNGTIVKLSKNV